MERNAWHVPAGAAAAPTEDDTLRFKVATFTVTAQREPDAVHGKTETFFR